MLKLFYLLIFLPFTFYLEVRAEILCQSVNNIPIEHFDFLPKETGLKKKILVLGQTHGDETEAGILSDLWLERLKTIQSPSNHWRLIPLVNPDGVKLKTRTNASGVDLNRNFPTKDWDEHATQQWKTKLKSDKRRFPGEKAGSEPEVKCMMKHIEEFKPDIIVSLHTPYGLFDFDGPLSSKAISNVLPWKRLGTFPGSLGRWAWDERQIPVLTIEIRPKTFKRDQQKLIHVQDKISDLIPHLNN